jgi:outer membrane protein OmpA-like peptidoglycan-associated protein/Mg-chelatase subunit ChlD
MRKVLLFLLLAIFFNSCQQIQPIIDQLLGKKPDNKTEEVLLDQEPPPGYDPVFILGEKQFNSILDDPKMVISRVDAHGEKVKVYFHIYDENLLMQGGSELKDIWCEVTDTINGKSRKITDFKIKEVNEDADDNLAIALVMDHSGSMGNPRARVMQEAIAEFIRDKFPNDLISLIRYDHRTFVKMEPIPSELDLLMEHEVNGLEGMGGGTKTIQALDSAVNILSRVDGDYTKVAVVFTDGINSDLSGFNELIASANKNKVVISGVDYGYNITPNFLDVIANKTNGIYHHIYKTEEFNYVFNDLYNRMNNYYVLEFDQPEYGDHSIYIKTCLESKTIEDSYTYNNTPLPGEVVLLKVYFDTGKFDLKPASDVAIARLEGLLKSDNKLKVQIAGHTDDVGDEEANQILSQNRAQAVSDELVKRGIAKSRITVKGYGEASPIASNSTKEGRAKNRRVEFTLF